MGGYPFDYGVFFFFFFFLIYQVPKTIDNVY